jgi:hypothetical protein
VTTLSASLAVDMRRAILGRMAIWHSAVATDSMQLERTRTMFVGDLVDMHRSI